MMRLVEVLKKYKNGLRSKESLESMLSKDQNIMKLEKEIVKSCQALIKIESSTTAQKESTTPEILDRLRKKKKELHNTLVREKQELEAIKNCIYDYAVEKADKVKIKNNTNVDIQKVLNSSVEIACMEEKISVSQGTIWKEGHAEFNSHKEEFSKLKKEKEKAIVDIFKKTKKKTVDRKKIREQIEDIERKSACVVQKIKEEGEKKSLSKHFHLDEKDLREQYLNLEKHHQKSATASLKKIRDDLKKEKQFLLEKGNL